MILKFLLPTLFFAIVKTQVDTSYQTITSGQVFFVNSSPDYDANYAKGVIHKWIANCPSAYCRADCYDLSIPQSSSCSEDALHISRTGDENLTDAEMICGFGATTIVSNGDKLALGLKTSSDSTGGRFRCKITSTSSPDLPPCTCGNTYQTKRIFNGTETGVNEYPMMAALAVRGDNEYVVFCGAVIIDKRYVMSSAHCFHGMTPDWHVLVGEHSVEDDDPVTQFIPIESHITHPLYSSSNNDYDVALVRLSRDIEFNPRVGPVCMPFKFRGNSFANTITTVLGWGSITFGGPKSSTLQKVNLNILPDNECTMTVTPRQFCTYYPGKDACQYDSGGPLLHTDSSTGLLYTVGIVSKGIQCGIPEPGTNTRVTEIMNWVADRSPDAFYCIK